MRRFSILGLPGRFFRDRRAATALIVALSTPLLIAITGLSVDIGYWYQQEETLQSAADAAALAAAVADSKYGDTTAASVKPFALAAANNATNGQFALTNATLTITAGGTTTPADGSTLTSFVATAQIPRGSFFSGVKGIGFAGTGAGTQSARATADVVASPQPLCLIATNTTAAETIYANGSSQIASTSCAYASDSTACAGGDGDSIAADPSGQISGSAITTAGCTYAATGMGAYVGIAGGSSSNGATTGYKVTNNAAAATDPLAGMGSPPAWPAMTVPGTGYANISGDIGYISSGTRGGVTCDNYNANCTVQSGNYSGVNAVNAASLQFNDPSTGTTNIIGGFGGSENTKLVLNATNYDIAGPVNAANTVTGWAMTINTPIFTVAGGTDEFDGGMLLNGSSPVTTFGTGTYMFSAYSSGTAALDDSNANITFGGGTYYFNGGLTVEGNGTVTFGPGIYYVENGNLTFSAGSHVTVNGATFVLENGAGYQLNGGSVALNMTAPSSNCVAPTSYPEAAYTDGTNGEGICGILIYQARTDLAADSVVAGAAATVTGIIYAPGGALSVSGGASIEAASSSQTFALVVNSLSATGGTMVEPTLATSSVLGAATSTSTTLVN